MTPFVKTHFKRAALCTSAALGFGFALSASALAAETNADVRLMAQNSSANAAIAQAARPSVKPGFEQFAPKAQSKRTRIDYAIWDEALGNVVLDLGPSSRQRASRPQAQTGTRRVRGHKSAYRLEGSRVTFAYMSDEYREGLTLYRQDLESVASQVDITRLSRDEQLSYWLNLHNTAIIEKIALNYPTQRPSNIRIQVDGTKYSLDDAPFLNVRGTKMSLRDIREQIVYANWSDPKVIYGFYRGNIGSPMLPSYAYKASNLDYVLDRNAREFVNALRGFNQTLNHRNVSEIYEETRPYYFPAFDRDLESHLLKYADEAVKPEIQSGKPFRLDRYDDMISDLSGGQRLASSGLASQGQLSVSYETQRLLAEVQRKQEYLRRRNITGKGVGYVIIEDLVPADQQNDQGESGVQ